MFGEFSFLSSTSGRWLPLQVSPWQQKGCGATVPCPFVTVLATLAGTHHENPAAWSPAPASLPGHLSVG